MFSTGRKMKRCNHSRWKHENRSMHFCCLPRSKDLIYLSSCYSATIADQIGGMSMPWLTCLSSECDLLMTGLLELIAYFACTISLKSASSCVDIRLCMELISDIDNRWQYPSVDRYRIVVLSVFNVFLLLSINH